MKDYRAMDAQQMSAELVEMAGTAATPDLQECYQRAAALLDHPAQGTAEWQPIKTAPKIEKGCYRAIPFLAWCPDDTAPDGGDQRIVWWEPRIKNGCWWGDRDLEETPTHWKPLGARP